MNTEELRALDELENLKNSNWQIESDIHHYQHERNNEMSSSSGAITSLVVGVAFVAFLLFLICLCCPFCLLAKYRKRRGHVYSQPQLVTAQTATLTQGSRGVRGPQVIAINNPQRQNAHYPVQQSVTVVPHVTHPAAHHPHGHYPPYGNVPSPYQGQSHTPMPMNNDLPPPYPGLPRETASGIETSSQPSYNPYYDTIGDHPSAPYPSKYGN